MELGEQIFKPCFLAVYQIQIEPCVSELSGTADDQRNDDTDHSIYQQRCQCYAEEVQYFRREVFIKVEATVVIIVVV